MRTNFKYVARNGSSQGSFYVATILVSGGPGICILAGSRDFSPKRRDSLQRPPSFLLKRYRGSFPPVKWPGRDVYYRHSRCAEINPLNTELNPICQ